METHLTSVIAGFIPLLDSAVLVAAKEMEFAEKEGVALKLVRESSWANIRDRIAVGHFDVAHMLAPMPIAASLNLTSLSVPMLAPMVLGLGGNAITVSKALWTEMVDQGADRNGDPLSTGAALARAVRARVDAAGSPFRFGVVHPFSGHAYELRYWLAAAGIKPDRDVEISVLAPQLMADALAAGQLDGYCVGEPWNTAAVNAGTGRIVTYKQAIWPNSPEKVLGMTRMWAGSNPDTLAALMRAMSAAADWCSNPQNVDLLSEILAGEDYLDCEPEICRPALAGEMRLGKATVWAIPDFLKFSGGQAAAPSPAHGKWFYEQMIRWGQAEYSERQIDEVTSIFSPSLFVAALGLQEMPATDQIRLFDTP